VLEHVSDPARALGEFKRCLTANGYLVAQTPYAPRLKQTFEMSRPVSSAFATVFFGQDDHVRLFGDDMVDFFHAAGLKGALLAHHEILGNTDPQQWGINEHEPFFLFTKGEMPACLSSVDV